MGHSFKLERYLVPQIRRDLERKMVFVAGPRQVGKTTLALGLPGAAPGYLSWDVPEHRERILKRELPLRVGAEITSHYRRGV